MTISEERAKLREDVLSCAIPKRVPVYSSFTLEAACGFAGIDLIKAHYDPELTEKAYTAICDNFYSDSYPVKNMHFPESYQILGNRSWVLGSNGAMQHPEIEPLSPSEYDELIADPYGCVLEKLLPRICTNLNSDPIRNATTLAKAYGSYRLALNTEREIAIRLSKKYGYSPGMVTGQPCLAPFDSLSDNYRGFKGVVMDIRRVPDKVEAAVEAILPIMKKMATPKKIVPGIINFIPLHLAPFISKSQFDRFYWPTFEKLIHYIDGLGLKMLIFAEQDWTRYRDYLSELPESVIVMFEYGDYRLLKETVGKRHIITGFYDPTITLTRSKEECIDEAKRLVEACAPGGRYYFTFDKSIMDINSVDVHKLQAVLDWLHANTDY